MKKRLISLVALIMGTITFVGCSGKTIPTVKRSEILAESSVSSELPSFTKTENEDKNNVDLYKEESDNKITEEKPDDRVSSQPVISEHEDVNLLGSMSQGERTEVNQFLSNFSEAFYGLWYSETEDKVRFAYKHICINGDPSCIKYEAGGIRVPATEIDRVLKRFFGSSVPHKTPEASQTVAYRDGCFIIEDGDGESNAYFTVATDMREHSGGNYVVKFSVFHDDYHTHETLQSWYSLTYDEVKSNPGYNHKYDGEAVVKPKGNTYELVSYKTYSN